MVSPVATGLAPQELIKFGLQTPLVVCAIARSSDEPRPSIKAASKTAMNRANIVTVRRRCSMTILKLLPPYPRIHHAHGLLLANGLYHHLLILSMHSDYLEPGSLTFIRVVS